MKKRAFTLIELLVVISIIAVLMSIMMPAMQKVRNKAKEVVCSTNIKSLSSSMMLYLEDNNKYFPTKGIGADGIYNTKDDFYWDDAMFTYIQNYDVFKCPITISNFKESVKKIESDLRGVPKWKHPETYRFNAWLQGWGGFNNSKPWPDSHGSTVVPNPLSISQVRNTASVVMFVDGSGVGGGLSGVRQFSYFYNGGPRYMPDIMPAHDLKLKNNGVIIPFHQIPECSGGVNAGFSDGHVERIPSFDYTVDTVNRRVSPKDGIKLNPIGSEL